jgi:transposase
MIRFVMINDRIPARSPFCAACGNGLENGYVHDRQSDLRYCTSLCFRYCETTVRATPKRNTASISWRRRS